MVLNLCTVFKKANESSGYIQGRGGRAEHRATDDDRSGEGIEPQVRERGCHILPRRRHRSRLWRATSNLPATRVPHRPSMAMAGYIEVGSLLSQFRYWK